MAPTLRRARTRAGKQSAVTPADRMRSLWIGDPLPTSLGRDEHRDLRVELADPRSGLAASADKLPNQASAPKRSFDARW
ncbi:MAG: hypothetical protein ACHQ4F_04175 [Candidatus Dormibacteria bacterium]